MQINEHKDIKGQTVTIKKVIGHTLSDKEIELLHNISLCEYGYRLSNLEITDYDFNQILYTLKELELVTTDSEDFCTVYYITEFGKEFLNKNLVGV